MPMDQFTSAWAEAAAKREPVARTAVAAHLNARWWRLKVLSRMARRRSCRQRRTGRRGGRVRRSVTPLIFEGTTKGPADDRCMGCRACRFRKLDVAPLVDGPTGGTVARAFFLQPQGLFRRRIRIAPGSATPSIFCHLVAQSMAKYWDESHTAVRGTLAPRLGGSWPSSSALGALLQTAAAFLAAFLVWHQWSRTSDAFSKSIRDAQQGESQQSSPHAEAPRAPVLANAPTVAPQAQPMPAVEEPSNAVLAATAEASPPASQESLLALTAEHTEKMRQSSEGSLAENSTRFEVHPDAGTESDMSMAASADMDWAPMNRSATVRRVNTNPRPFYKARTNPSRVTPLAALAITGPCDRYNPWGEAICASAPSPQRPVHGSKRPGR